MRNISSVIGTDRKRQLYYDKPRDARQHRRKREKQSKAAFETSPEKPHLRKSKNRKNDQQPAQNPCDDLENADYWSPTCHIGLSGSCLEARIARDDECYGEGGIGPRKLGPAHWRWPGV